ncbi:MAG TPA: XRE family transcriptional regulator, partial [Beijerinckiaceae bacterium]|nr:XRE family transcriptional regulator [Beijerinckiaceae bacterium]
PADIAAVTRGMPDFSDLPEPLHQRAAELGEGSVRRALSVLEPKRLAFNDRVEATLAGLPHLDGNEIDAIAEQTAGRTGEEAFVRFCELCESWLAREMAERPRDVAALAPLSELWNRLGEGRRDVEAYNLDRRPFVIAMIADLAAAARRPVRA